MDSAGSRRFLSNAAVPSAKGDVTIVNPNRKSKTKLTGREAIGGHFCQKLFFAN